MDKNYYDILQVNRNASPEIIEKAYKTLAKKYHPDLQTEENKKQSEEILKEINEAYEVLSDVEKKQNYDTSLLEKEKKNISDNSNLPNEKYTSDTLNKEWIHEQQQKKKLQYEEELAYQKKLQYEQELAYQEQLQQAREKAYYDAYIQDLKSRGYKIRYKRSWKDYIKSFIAILITILFLFLLWQIPFVKNYFINLYEENNIFRLMIDFILNLFNFNS